MILDLTLQEHRSAIGLVDYAAPFVLGLIIGWRVSPAISAYTAARKAGAPLVLAIFAAMSAAAGMPTT